MIDRQQLLQSLPQQSADYPIQVSPCWQDYYRFYGFESMLPGCQLQIAELSCQGQQLLAQQITPAESRGTVLVVHGYMDHFGLYSKLVTRLLAERWKVIGLDLPGHGLSSGARNQIDSFSDYAAAIDVTLKHFFSGRAPAALIGQSTGCAAILQYGLDFPAAAPKAARLLLAPLVRCRHFPLVQLQYQILNRLIETVPRRYSDNSHDLQFLDFLHNQDPLQHDRMGVRWVGAMIDWAARVKELEISETPLWIAQGQADLTVDWRYNTALLSEKFPRTQVMYLEGARHHLVNEAEQWREPLFDELLAQLESLAPAAKGELASTRAEA